MHALIPVFLCTSLYLPGPQPVPCALCRVLAGALSCVPRVLLCALPYDPPCPSRNPSPNPPRDCQDQLRNMGVEVFERRATLTLILIGMVVEVFEDEPPPSHGPTYSALTIMTLPTQP